MKRTSVLLLTLTLFTVLFAGSAQATRWDAFDASADCAGWTVDAAAKVGSAHAPYVEIPYLVTLSQDGQVVDSFDGTVLAYFQMNADEFSLTRAWTAELSGMYTVEGVFTLPGVTTGDSVMTFVTEIDCGETGVMAHKPRWWKRHCNAWPVENLGIGSANYSKGELICLMHANTNHRVVKRLLRHLTAAKLNVLNGVDNEVAGTIAAADAFFAAEGINPILTRAERREIRALMRELRQFNRNRLGGDKAMAADESGNDLLDFEHETMNFSDLKEIWR